MLAGDQELAANPRLADCVAALGDCESPERDTPQTRFWLARPRKSTPLQTASHWEIRSHQARQRSQLRESNLERADARTCLVW